MDTVLEEVDKRSRLALSNQMEMLIFYLNDEQLYGINVFKIIEILECPPTVTKMPLSNPAVKGTIDFRGKAVVVIDLGDVLGMEPLDFKNSLSYVIICEYNNAINGFMVKRPDTLLTRGWDEIKSPSGMLTQSAYLTAIAYADNGETIQILDIEKILAEILGLSTELSSGMAEQACGSGAAKMNVLVVDDSATARMSVTSVLDQLGVRCMALDSAVNAVQLLEDIYKRGVGDKFDLVISDIEMPGMDGFTFTRMIRQAPETSGLYVILHSSLSNPSNKDKADQVGANEFVAKFQPDILAGKVLDRIKALSAS